MTTIESNTTHYTLTRHTFIYSRQLLDMSSLRCISFLALPPFQSHSLKESFVSLYHTSRAFGEKKEQGSFSFWAINCIRQVAQAAVTFAVFLLFSLSLSFFSPIVPLLALATGIESKRECFLPGFVELLPKFFLSIFEGIGVFSGCSGTLVLIFVVDQVPVYF